MDERLLYDTFSAFGVMATTAKVRTICVPFRILSEELVDDRLLATHKMDSPKATALFLIPTSNPPTQPLKQ